MLSPELETLISLTRNLVHLAEKEMNGQSGEEDQKKAERVIKASARLRKFFTENK